MSSLILSGAMEDVNVGSGLTRSRLVVRRAVDWCRWKDSGDALNGRYVEELDGNMRLGRLAYAVRETMVFISPSSTVSSVWTQAGIYPKKKNGRYVPTRSRRRIVQVGHCLGSTRTRGV